MALSITHAFVATGSETAGAEAAGKVVTSKWNAEHVVTGLDTALAALGVEYNVVLPLTASQIATNDSVPIVGVASPGSGYGVRLIDCMVIRQEGLVPWAADIELGAYYTGDEGGTLLTKDPMLIGAIEVSGCQYGLKSTNTIFLPRALVEDNSITLYGSGDDTTPGADGTAIVILTLRKFAFS